MEAKLPVKQISLNMTPIFIICVVVLTIVSAAPLENAAAPSATLEKAASPAAINPIVQTAEKTAGW